MTHDENAGIGHRADTARDASAAFALDRVTSHGDVSPRARDRRLVTRLVAHEGQIADDERTRHAAHDRAREYQHLVHGHADRARQPQHRHRDRVADEDHVDAGAIREHRRGIIVRGDEHRVLAARAKFVRVCIVTFGIGILVWLAVSGVTRVARATRPGNKKPANRPRAEAF